MCTATCHTSLFDVGLRSSSGSLAKFSARRPETKSTIVGAVPSLSTLQMHGAL